MSVDLRLALPTGFAWLTVGIAIAWPAGLPVLAAAGWISTGLLIVAAAVVRRPVLVLAIVACCASSVLLTSAAVGSPHRQPAMLVEAAEAGRFVSATAMTTQTVFDDTGSFTVSLRSVEIGGQKMEGAIPARVFGPPPGIELGMGATITVTGTLAASAPADDLAFLLFTEASPIVVGASPWFLDWANSLRATFRAAASTLPGAGGDLLPGLAIGDTSAVGADLDGAMKTSSLSHLTAVSGANCAVVIGLIMLAGGLVGIPRGWRVAASVAVLVGFIVLVTPEPSVLRAGVMALLVLVSLAGGRPARGVAVLSVAVIGLLAFDPWLARSYGFVLSVLATAGLLLLAGPLTTALARWLPVPIAAILAIPLAAQLACQPVLILLEASIPTYGVVANTLAGPAAPAATVLGLLACVVLPWGPQAGALVAQVAWLPASWIAAVATFFADLPGNRLAWLEGATGVALVALVTVLCLIVTLKSDDAASRVRRVAASVLALLLFGYLGVVAGNNVRTMLTRPSDWQYAACDIGQGDAVLVRSAGEVALIDTGPDPDAVSECLDALGIGRIDLLALTHFDLDHVGGTTAVLGRVDRVLVGPSDGADADRLMRDLSDAGATIEQVSRGSTGVLGNHRWTVLWPPTQLRGLEPGNDASVTLEFDGVGECAGGCLDSVFLGDLGEQAQSLVLATNNRIGPTDVVKVAHHGSADQSERLYERLGATIGLISVGAKNTYGHPSDRVLDVLAAGGSTVGRTDVMGLVLVAPGEDGAVGMWSERPG